MNTLKKIMVEKMDKELEQVLKQKIEELKKIVKQTASPIYGADLRIYDIRLQEEIVHHFGGGNEKVLEFYVNTDKGYFRVTKSYPVSEDAKE